MKIFTIGFTKKSAEAFFATLTSANISKLIDIRLNNSSQLAGFTKENDLRYFVRRICNIGYEHMPQLAPTKNILDEFKKSKGQWATYERNFLGLMAERKIEDIDKSMLDGGCLLCSEDKPEYCHRRLVAEYLQGKWRDVEIVHL